MSVYTLPSLKVRQVFEPVLDAGGTPLAALVIGPQYGLHRVGVTNEETLLGVYDRENGHDDVSYPEKVAGSAVDPNYGGVFIDQAFVQYAFELETELTADDGNRVTSDSLVFKTANGVNRSAVFGDRDVELGDYFEASYMVGSEEELVTGTIVGFAAEQIAAEFGAITPRAGNTGTDSPVRAGTYTGTADAVYMVRIIQGGEVGEDQVIFDVFTVNGIDNHPQTIVVPNDATSVGIYGLTVTFNTGDVFVAGDVFTVEATAATEGAVNTLVLSSRLDDGNEDDTITITLGLDPGLSEVRGEFYTMGTAGVTVLPGASISGDFLGVGSVFPILVGDVHVEYRELLREQANVLGSVRTTSESRALCGEPDVDNPLGLHTMAAVTTAGGVPVYFIGVSSDDRAGYLEAITVAENSRVPYSLVPCTLDSQIQADVVSHVLSMSTPEIGMWRKAWLAAAPAYSGVRDVSVEEGELDGRVLSNDDALFQTAGVVPGDIVRIGYVGDSYQSFVIDEVVSETEIRLIDIPDLPQDIPLKFEVWYQLSDNDYAQAIAEEATSFANRRVNLLWGENPTTGGGSVPMTVLAAANAGLRSAVAPHQPLTNVEVDGIQVDVPRFSRHLLDYMAGNGVWIVTKDQDGPAYNRHQVTTGTQDINHREDSVTTNLDHISRDFRSSLANYYGRGNVSDEMIGLIDATLSQVVSSITSRPYSSLIGPQIQGITEQTIARDPAIRDRVNVTIIPVLPYPLNDLDVTIVIQ